MKMRSWLRIAFLLVLIQSVAVAQIIEPEAYFGFRMGADYKLAGWEKIISYFNHLASHSDKVSVETLGRSTQDNPFIMAVITSAENQANLDEIKGTARLLSDPRRLTEESAKELAREGKIIVLITCSLHATEVGAAQATPELAHWLATDSGPECKRILESVVFLLVPSFNPDGLIMVKEWYDQYVETEFEGSSMPWLYQKYVGHDNNRDAFMLTQVESRLVNRVLYHDWFPQVYLDVHQMGNSASRIFVPPFIDPLNFNTPPLIVWELGLLGQHMAMTLESEGKTGVGNSHFFTGWWEGSFLMNVWWHNTVGLLTELASCKIATPIFQTQDDLSGRRGFDATQKRTNFPNPWKGGWWRLRDIVEYDIIAARSLLTASALNRETLLYNRYLMGRNSVEAGRRETPFAFVIPPLQSDPGTAQHMVNLLLEGGVEIHTALAAFEADRVPYPAGTQIVYMAQPFRAYAKDLLEPQVYPEMRTFEGGPPIQPYDVAGWTLPFQMGVNTTSVTHPFTVDTRRLSLLTPEQSIASSSRNGYSVSAKENNAYILCNRLLSEGVTIYRADGKNTEHGLDPGDFYIPGRQSRIGELLRDAAKGLQIRIKGLNTRVRGSMLEVKPVRIGVYQPWISSMHEGWSRWVLERYEFPYKNIQNAEIRAGDLNSRYDVIYLPDIRAEGILKGREKGRIPPRFAEGIGAEGLTHLKNFVKAGGVLVTMDSSSELVIGELGLPVRNVLKTVKSEDFFCPGSILSMQYNPDHELAFGMSKSGIAFFARSPAFKIVPNFNTEAVAAAHYPSANLLKSGWLLGESLLANRAAIIDVPLEAGHVILIGFDAINRAQAHGTFKIFFNSLMLAGQREQTL